MKAGLSFTACMLGFVYGLGATGSVDTETLPRLLQGRGFVAPQAFKALVVRLKRGAQGGVAPEYFDWHGSSTQNDFWPASTVKLYAAVAALERTRALGFSPAAKVTFHYPEGPFVVRVRELVQRALVPSDNRAYDQLVELVGFDALHGEFLSARHGFAQTALLRSYFGRVRDPVTGNGLAGDSPVIDLEQGKKLRTLPARVGKRKPACPEEQGNCTTLRELAHALLRVVLHDELPESERFGLGPAELKLLRQCLSAERPRGMNVVAGLREAFGSAGLRVWHKPGFALHWFSDVVFVEQGERRWLVAMAGFPGRESLDSASRHVGALLASGKL